MTLVVGPALLRCAACAKDAQSRQATLLVLAAEPREALTLPTLAFPPFKFFSVRKEIQRESQRKQAKTSQVSSQNTHVRLSQFKFFSKSIPIPLNSIPSKKT